MSSYARSPSARQPPSAVTVVPSFSSLQTRRHRCTQRVRRNSKPKLSSSATFKHPPLRLLRSLLSSSPNMTLLMHTKCATKPPVPHPCRALPCTNLPHAQDEFPLLLPTKKQSSMHHKVLEKMPSSLMCAMNVCLILSILQRNS